VCLGLPGAPGPDRFGVLEHVSRSHVDGINVRSRGVVHLSGMDCFRRHLPIQVAPYLFIHVTRTADAGSPYNVSKGC
jgi:hypothetical protein